MNKKFIVLIILVIGFYFWTATAGRNDFELNVDHGGHYNTLARSFLQGQLNLIADPDPRLLALEDPYDPRANDGLRIHDLSLYKKKYYLYNGPIAAVVIYIPYLLLFNNKGMPYTLAIFIFSCLGFIFSSLLLLHLKNKYFSEMNEWIFYLCVLFSAVGNLSPWLMNRPEFYEVAISSGYCFFIGGIYFLCKGLSEEVIHKAFVCLGSLFLGLSIGGRPNMVIAATVTIFLCIIKIFLSHKARLKETLFILLKLLLPFGICLLLLGLYNYFRFNSPFEFGTKYQLTADKIERTMSLKGLYANIYMYLFKPYRLDTIFPFIHTEGSFVPPNIPRPNPFIPGVMVGYIQLFPFVLLILFAPIIYLIQFVYKPKSFAFSKASIYEMSGGLFKGLCFNFWITFLSACTTIFILLCWWTGGQMRYEPDFGNLLIIAAIISWQYFLIKLKNMPILKLILNLAGILLLVWSFLVGLFFSIDGEHGGLRTRNYYVYKQLEEHLNCTSNALDKIYPNWEKVRSSANPLAYTISVSSALGNDLIGENLIDNNDHTDWAPAECVPSWIIIKPPHPIRVKSIWFLSRETALFETWKKVDAEFYLDKDVVERYSFDFPQASKERIQHAKLDKPTLTNKIKLFVSDPVTENQRGDYFHPIGAKLHPGYSEIKLDWEY